MLIAKHPEEQEVRVLCRLKCNLSPGAAALSYTLESYGEVSRVKWLGVVHFTAGGLLAAARQKKANARNAAEEFLEDTLEEGPVKTKEVEEKAREVGIHESTLNRARRRLGVVSRRVDDQWVLSLPPNAKGVTESPSEDGTPLAPLTPFEGLEEGKGVKDTKNTNHFEERVDDTLTETEPLNSADRREELHLSDVAEEVSGPEAIRKSGASGAGEEGEI
jgi:hypothetical protein